MAKGSNVSLLSAVHPIVVHIPIVLLAVVWLLVAYRHRRGDEGLERHIQRVLAAGVVLLPVVFLSGLGQARWTAFIADIDWRRPLVWHYLAATAATAAFVAYFFYRKDRLEAGTLTARADINFATAGVWLLLMTGLIGGQTVIA